MGPLLSVVTAAGIAAVPARYQGGIANLLVWDPNRLRLLRYAVIAHSELPAAEKPVGHDVRMSVEPLDDQQASALRAAPLSFTPLGGAKAAAPWATTRSINPSR